MDPAVAAPRAYPNRVQGARMLVLCCSAWAFSFPLAKAVQMMGAAVAPGAGSVFLAALLVVFRFGFGALAIFILLRGSIRGLTRCEFKQGLGLGLFGGVGILLQFDGLTYTSGSVSAFLTQGYCVWIPIWWAIVHRRLPGWNVTAACALAVVGAAILSGVSWNHLRLGRGEWETIIGSVIFTGQILWLERPEFAGNQVLRFSLVMFAVMTAVCAPVAVWMAPTAADLLRVYASVPAVGMMAVLVLLCTLFTFLTMNRWQPEVPSTEAGILYCTEPVFTSLLCLFLPALLSRWGGIDYPNEVLTWRLLAGGSLIVLANIWLQIRPMPS